MLIWITITYRCYIVHFSKILHLANNVWWLTDLSGEVEPLVSVIFYLILNQLMNISVNDWDKNLFSDKSKSPNGCKKIKVGSPK